MSPRTSEATRCGFIALAGAPNVGKSTLVNRLVGQKVVIVSSRPQTTRHRVCGILTEKANQAIFVDVPGIMRTENRFNLGLVQCARAAIEGCELILHLRSAKTAGSADEEATAEALRGLRRPIWEIRNKIDLKGGRGRAQWPSTGVEYGRRFEVSAKTGAGLGELKSALTEALPLGPWLYPADDVSDRDLRFLSAEIVREKLFIFLREEIPYGLATYTESWEERPGGLTYLGIEVLTEREAHKKIVVGSGGAMVKKIGQSARREIEDLIGGRVYLDLWVRVRPNWRRRPEELERLGLIVHRG